MHIVRNCACVHGDIVKWRTFRPFTAGSLNAYLARYSAPSIRKHPYAWSIGRLLLKHVLVQFLPCPHS